MHTLKTTLATGLLVLASYHPAMATATATETAAEADCMQTARSQSAMNGCAHRQYAEADARLNARYRELISQLSDNTAHRQMLVEAQRRWIDFRDAECRFNASSVEGGSAQPMVYSLCLTDVTARRSSELGAYLKCEEGDLSCPASGSRSD